jgi:type IV secretory pathway TraG/TraD family ATPase VirD4
VAARDETKHFKLIGTTGTGKSTAVQEMLAGALGRGDRAVIADPDYGYVRRFYDPRRGDVILNPFDGAALKWDLFGEITETYDVDQLARSLIPDQGGTDKSWREYARTFFTAVTQQARAGGETQIEELNRLLLVADPEELRTLVQGTPAQSFLRESNARMFDSIRSVTSSAVSALGHVANQKAQLFSVRKWVQQEKRGVLFMPYRAGQIAALRSSISAWMRLAIFEAMNQPEGDQRLWFVVDELDALGQIDGLKDALARLRKFGGRCVLGFQSIAQVSSTYGAGEAQTIVENCGNTLILRCAASEHGGTSHFASRLIGQREVVRTTVSRSRRPLQWLPSITRAEHSSIEPAVLDSEIEQLPDLNGYLKFASVPNWYRVRLTPEASTVLTHGRDASGGARSGVTGTRAEERQTGGHVRGHVSGGGNVRD